VPAVLVPSLCQHVVVCVAGVLDEGASSPRAQFAEQIARRATLDRRCDEVGVCVFVCLSVCPVSVCLSVSLSLVIYTFLFLLVCFATLVSDSICVSVVYFCITTFVRGQINLATRLPGGLHVHTVLIG